MTRLGHGGLTLNRDWIGVDELVGSAVTRLQRYQPEARFEVTLEPDLAIWVHPALLEQALFNVIENAAKFSPPGEAVAIDARRTDGRRLAHRRARPRPGHSRGRAQAHLRHVLQRRARRSRPPGHRPGAGDLPGHDRRARRQRRGLARAAMVAAPRSALPCHVSSRCPSTPHDRRPHRRATVHAASAGAGHRRRAADPQVPRHQPACAGLSGGNRGERRGAGWKRWPRTAPTW